MGVAKTKNQSNKKNVVPDPEILVKRNVLVSGKIIENHVALVKW